MFSVKEIDLELKNKKNVTFSIIEKKDSVMIVPITDDGKLILIKEYFAVTNNYQVGLPKGRIDNGNALKATNRELQEETGYKTKDLAKLGILSVSPGNLRHNTHVYLARKLIQSKLKGDEIEDIKIIKIPFANFEKLIGKEITEARMIAALYMANKYLKNKK